MRIVVEPNQMTKFIDSAVQATIKRVTEYLNKMDIKWSR